MNSKMNKNKKALPFKVVKSEVPSEFRQLMRLFANVFFDTGTVRVVHLLVRFQCIKKADILEILNIDAYSFNKYIYVLINMKIVRKRYLADIYGDTEPPPRTCCYFIHYPSLVRVLKQRLEQMRIKTGELECDNIAPPFFKCNDCNEMYPKTHVFNLFDEETKRLVCIKCNGLCKGLPQEITKQLTKPSKVAQFNEYLSEFYDLLRAVEGVKLPNNVLYPEIECLAAKRMAMGHDPEEETKKNDENQNNENIEDESIEIKPPAKRLKMERAQQAKPKAATKASNKKPKAAPSRDAKKSKIRSKDKAAIDSNDSENMNGVEDHVDAVSNPSFEDTEDLFEKN